MPEIIRLKQKNVLEICDKCGTHQVISPLEISLAMCDPFWGKCPNCGTDTRKVYEGNFLGGISGREDK